MRALDDDAWGAGARLRDVVDGYSARIGLDGETVIVSMVAGRLLLRAGRLAVRAGGEPPTVDGDGATSSGVVLAILDGRLEATEAVERGLVHAAGSPEAVLRMFHAIELILDASSRVPALRRLASDFRRERAGAVEETPSSPTPPGPGELALLERLGVANST